MLGHRGLEHHPHPPQLVSRSRAPREGWSNRNCTLRRQYQQQSQQTSRQAADRQAVRQYQANSTGGCTAHLPPVCRLSSTTNSLFSLPHFGLTDPKGVTTSETKRYGAILHWVFVPRAALSAQSKPSHGLPTEYQPTEPLIALCAVRCAAPLSLALPLSLFTLLRIHPCPRYLLGTVPRYLPKIPSAGSWLVPTWFPSHPTAPPNST